MLEYIDGRQVHTGLELKQYRLKEIGDDVKKKKKRMGLGYKNTSKYGRNTNFGMVCAWHGNAREWYIYVERNSNS